ncbi:BDM_1a_G0015660.mRNA.1.CDS.1 [Saccharomyces cerevisiae]|nr:BDM_1a_G0015660.mRNA.1.CDS.1 [Saccharomyces cerevisiae]CAI7103848.1 BDM_1a_G0015660.mRNA.1.CDS.1 [Saccharomyces cerevisiae]
MQLLYKFSYGYVKTLNNAAKLLGAVNCWVLQTVECCKLLESIASCIRCSRITSVNDLNQFVFQSTAVFFTNKTD